MDTHVFRIAHKLKLVGPQRIRPRRPRMRFSNSIRGSIGGRSITNGCCSEGKSASLVVQNAQSVS